MTSLEEGNLLIFYHLNASAIWPNKKTAVGERGLIRGRGAL
jgi:hypothetical protein